MDHLNKHNYFSKTFELFEKDGRTPLDLSDTTVRYIIKKSKSDADSEALLPVKEYVHPDTNILLFEYTALETADLLPGTYIQALKLFRDNHKDEEVWVDTLRIEEGVFHG